MAVWSAGTPTCFCCLGSGYDACPLSLGSKAVTVFVHHLCTHWPSSTLLTAADFGEDEQLQLHSLTRYTAAARCAVLRNGASWVQLSRRRLTGSFRNLEYCMSVAWRTRTVKVFLSVKYVLPLCLLASTAYIFTRILCCQLESLSSSLFHACVVAGRSRPEELSHACPTCPIRPVAPSYSSLLSFVALRWLPLLSSWLS
jgi:hypothetical protein